MKASELRNMTAEELLDAWAADAQVVIDEYYALEAAASAGA